MQLPFGECEVLDSLPQLEALRWLPQLCPPTPLTFPWLSGSCPLLTSSVLGSDRKEDGRISRKKLFCDLGKTNSVTLVPLFSLLKQTKTKKRAGTAFFSLNIPLCLGLWAPRGQASGWHSGLEGERETWKIKDKGRRRQGGIPKHAPPLSGPSTPARPHPSRLRWGCLSKARSWN